MIKPTILSLLFILLFSCTDSIVVENTSANTFDTFWEIMDERYVFFEERHVNWDSIYTEFHPRFEHATNEEMQYHFNHIINYIGDSHVSMSCHDYYNSNLYVNSELWSTWIDFNLSLAYHKANNIKEFSPVTMAQLPDSILYFGIPTMHFTDIDLSGIDNAFPEYNLNNGVIIDVRDNTGGCSYSSDLASPFFSGEKTIYYNKYKTGKKHNDFSDFAPASLIGSGIINEDIPKVILCNHHTYSAGNYFTYIIKAVTDATMLGSKTGGGGGAVHSVTLPNNWILNYTVQKSYNTDKQIMEFGLAPDLYVAMSDTFIISTQNTTGEDPQLQRAINHLISTK